MRVIVAIAVLCILHIVCADPNKDPKKGATLLQPSTAGNASKGVTVLTPSGSNPTGECVTGSKGCEKRGTGPTDPNAAIAAPPPGMNHAIVIHPKGDCGCEKDEIDCHCERMKYVEPEIKHPPINCTCRDEEKDCECLRALRHRHRHHHEHHGLHDHHGHHDHKKHHIHETVAPEQAPNHVVPEVREKLHHILRTDCAGNACAPPPEFVQPEIKKECACAHLDHGDCPCAFLRSNF